MGTSKIIMLSGIYLILGMYNVSFSSADGASFDLASKTATAVQAEQIARTGIALAMTKMGGSYIASTREYAAVTASVMSGTVSYSAAQTGTGLPASQSLVTSTASYNGKTVVIKAVFSYDRNRWRIIRTYVAPVA